MEKKILFCYFLIIAILFIFPGRAISQTQTESQDQKVYSNPEVKYPVASDISIPLRDMVPVKHIKKPKEEEEELYEVPNRFRQVPGTNNAIDSAWQKNYNTSPLGPMAPLSTTIQNFAGSNNSSNPGYHVNPPDPTGDVGPNHYVQVVNGILQIFDKTGNSLYGPVITSTLWNGFNGPWTGHNNGDGIVLYDENADRWLISQFAIDCGKSGSYTEYEMIAISTTPDPTGSYYRYAFQYDYMPDYPKLGVWPDGYYMAINRFNTNTNGYYVGSAASVMERSKMLVGDPNARMLYFAFTTSNPQWSMLPSDCDGTFPASGTPNYFAFITGSSQLRIWAYHTDWTTTSNSTFSLVTNLTVSSYTESGDNIPQSGSTITLDGLGDRLMFRNQYRNFGSYESFVTCHNVYSGSVDGIRWYEYRKTGSTFSLYQQSTYAPSDGLWRWMGSVAMNAAGDMGLIYTASSSSTYPSIFFTGRRASDPINTMTVAEGTIQVGAASMPNAGHGTGDNRWGDYSALNIDPTDNITFWGTHEYVGTYGGTWPWATRIASFMLGSPPLVVTTAASSITGVSATLNGKINPNGMASNYYFDWGSSVSYGNSTTSTSAGSGNAFVNESANITGLTSGTTYHYRIVGTSSDGTTYGNDMTFTPGTAIVTTAAASSITTTTATSGGNVVSDGGSAVTARGVCWSTTNNPTISGNHTSDGSGTGVFTSSITGLTFGTTYYVRAYATNANGTYYGDNIIFTTSCVTFTLPFSESFTNATPPSCWTEIDNVNRGQFWIFGTITGYTGYIPSLSGNYAYFNSNTFGSFYTENTDLITPTIDMSAYFNITLGFKHYFRVINTQTGTVSYSTDNGSTWTTISTFTTTTANPATYSQVVSGLDGQALAKIKWNFSGNNGYYWAIDDVSITGTLKTLSVTPSNQNVTAPAGTTPYTVTSNYNWTVVSDQTWCTVTTSGSGNGTVTATYAQNTSLCSRVAHITVTVPGITPITVTVTQAGAVPTLSGTNSVCQGSAGNVYTTEAGMTNYVWSVTGGTITSGGTSTDNTATVTWNTSGTGNLSVNYTQSGCTAPSPTVYNVTVNPLLPVSVSISASGNPVCAGTSVTFTATPTNGGATPAYQWKVNGVSVGTNSTTYSYTPVTGDVVTCQLTSNATCPTGNPATSNPITMTVNPLLPVSVSISASGNPVCAGTSVTFTATPTNGGATPAYQWKVNGVSVGTNSTTYSYTPVTGDVVTCQLTSNATCPTGNPATSNAINMTVNPLLPVSVSISASGNPVCAGTSVTFTATPTNGGATPAYQWKVNGVSVGTNSTVYSYTPVTGDVVTCQLTSNATCPTGNPATSNAINMTVNPLLPVSVSISASGNPVCAGTSVTFTATPTNGGATPAYQWKVNGVSVGTNSTTYSYTPVTGDVVTCQLTSNATCPTGNPATSNAINMTVNPLLPVSVSISASGNPVCAGTSVTFTATPTNGGATPAYQWKVNGVSVGTNSTIYSYTPVTGDVVTCQLTSNATCPTGNPATSNAITMTVNPLLPVSVSISASGNPVCAGTSVTFTATPTNGGATPAYQWKVNGVSVGTNSTTYSYTPVTGDVVTCQLTSNATCPTGNPATSNAINMTVNPLLPVSVSISASGNPVCAGTSVTFTATPTNGGATPGYQWKVNGVSVGTNSTVYSYTPVTGDVVTCQLTSNATCPTGNPATSNAINMTVNPLLPVSVSISASGNPVCAGTSVTFTATPTNGGATPAYQWKVNGVSVGTNSTVYSYTPVTGDVVTCQLTSNATCPTGNPAISNGITITTNPLLEVSVSITASANPVCAGTSVTYTANPTNGGTTPAYQWKVNGNNVGLNSSEYSYVPVAGDVVTCILTSNAPCPNGNPATSNSITMTVNALPVPSVAGPTSVSVGSAGNVYSTEPGMSNYTWSITGGIITSGGGPTDNTATVTWNTEGTQSISVNYTESGCTASSPTIYYVIVNPLSTRTLNLVVYLEGLYAGGGYMNPAIMFDGENFVPKWGPTIADHITIELHDPANYSHIIYSISDIPLNINGTATVPFPLIYNGSYYLTIKHRNSIETVSVSPVSFSTTIITYNMSDAAAKAYGGNLKSMGGGVFAIYAGDVSSFYGLYPSAPVQDGVIDLFDCYYIYSSYLSGDFSYLPGDVNGDGVVDLIDDYIVYANYLLGIYAITP